MKDAIIIEGGALRGIHTSGVLDVLMNSNIYPSCVIGVSAGALNSYNYVARQPGRSARANLEYINDERYFNLLNVVKRKSVFDFDFMFKGLGELLPFDYDTFTSSAQRLMVVATDMATGKPEYFEKGVCSDIFAAGAASASVPLFTPPTVIDGKEYIDGGVSDPIPFEKALEEGYDRVVVVLTRHKEFRKPPLPFAERETAKRLYKDRPELLEVMFSANEEYNKKLDKIEQLEREGKLFVIRPTHEIDIAFLETDKDKLGYLYQEGINDGRRYLPELMDYLGIKKRVRKAGEIRKYDICDYISAKKLKEQIEVMNSFGSRLTGSPAQTKFNKWIKNEIRKMGLDVYSDPCIFERWEEKSSSLVLHDIGESVQIPLSSVFPYSGETDADGITAELEFVEKRYIDYINVNGKIAVIKVNNTDFLPTKIAFDKRRSLPPELDLPQNYTGPVATSFVNFAMLKAAKLAGARAAIFIWEGMSDESIQGQYLPFILDYQGLPAVWLNASNGRRIIEAAKEKKSATLTLIAEKEPGTETESFYCIMKGENRGEAVIVNTHTDGTNCIEENGAISLLALMDCLRDKKLSRTHIFVFVTGHFRLPMFKELQGGGMQATSKWLSAHPDLWDGKKGHIKAVAGISIEHLGCLEWKDYDGEYRETGRVEAEIVYTGNRIMDEIYYRALEDRQNVRTITMRGHNFLHFGEGQPLFNVKIPNIALVTAPDCLCVMSDSHEMEKFSAELMLEQTQTFLNCITLIDDMPTSAIGNCDQYSLIKVKK